MALGWKNKEPIRTPDEFLVIFEKRVDLDVLPDREDGVPVVVIVEGASGLPVCLCVVEEVALIFGNGQFGSGR